MTLFPPKNNTRSRYNLQQTLLISLLLSCLAYASSSFSNEYDNNTFRLPPAFSLQWGFVHFPPLIYRDTDGTYKGDLEVLMSEVSHFSGIPYIPMQFPNIRAIFNLNQQKVNFAIGVKTLVSEENNFFISAFPIAKMQLRVLWRKDSSPIKAIDDLAGKKLVLLNGYTYGGLRTKFEQLSGSFMDVEHHNRAIAAIKFNRADYALVYKTASEYSIAVVGQAEFEHTTLGEVELYFILDRNVPQAEQIMKKLETGYLLYQQSLNSNTKHLKSNIEHFESKPQ